MADTLTLRVLRYLPKNLISRCFGRLARSKRPRWFIRWFMSWFAGRFQIDLNEAEQPFDSYDCLQALFTRRLKEGARVVDQAPKILVSPVDACAGAFGRIESGRLIQAKGLDYTAEALLGDADLARAFDGGSFATLYLSPKDYHRIHTPCAGRVVRTIYEPGTLWPVNEGAVANVPQLFAVNERVTSILQNVVSNYP